MLIEISGEVDARLTKAARSLSEGYDKVIERLLDHWENKSSNGNARSSESGLLRFRPSDPPSLAFTSCDRILIDDSQLPRGETNWNRMLYAMARYLHVEKGLSGKDIISMLTIVNGEVGRITDRGYRYITEADISIQGKDSDSTYRQIYQLSLLANVPFEISFHWRSNVGAAHPGQRGIISFSGP